MFDDHFEVLLADTAWAKNIHYTLRYRVYCVQRGYENPEAFPDGRERDRYDSASAQFLVRSIESGEWLGGMRLIHLSLEDLPIKNVCEISRDLLPEIRYGQVAEASRLCAVAPKYTLEVGLGSMTPWIF